MRQSVLTALLLSFAPILLAGTAPEEASSDQAARDAAWWAKFIDPEDGWLDLSTVLDNPAGFIPLVIPITESAVGFNSLYSMVTRVPSRTAA